MISRFHMSSRWLFVVLCSVAWIGFVLWLTIPWIDDMGITFPVALALIIGLGIIPGVLNVRLLSELVFDDESQHPPGSTHA